MFKCVLFLALFQVFLDHGDGIVDIWNVLFLVQYTTVVCFVQDTTASKYLLRLCLSFDFGTIVSEHRVLDLYVPFVRFGNTR